MIAEMEISQHRLARNGVVAYVARIGEIVFHCRISNSGIVALGGDTGMLPLEVFEENIREIAQMTMLHLSARPGVGPMLTADDF